MSNNFLNEVLFPYDKIREYQQDMIKDAHYALKNKKNIIMHAPTGIGKTASVLGPALSIAKEKGLTVVFLTGRHMQHQIVLKTLREIKERFNEKINCMDLIGKKWMCLQQGIELMKTPDFHQFCKALRDEKKCEFYSNARTNLNTPTVESKLALNEMNNSGPCNVHQIIEIGEKHKLCPYELAIMSGDKAGIIISDYYYFFNDAIRKGFLYKINKELGKCILIVDEGHNLPQRIREMMTSRLTSFMIERAIKEAKKHNKSEAIIILNIVNSALIALENKTSNNLQRLIGKNEFIDNINLKKDYSIIKSELSSTGEEVIENQKGSFILGIARFLDSWMVEGDSFSRILTKNDNSSLTLMVKCLSPEIISKGIISEAYSTILMSGTLTPTSMYKDILGFPPDTIEKEYQSPFPKNNRTALIIPKTTTKFTERNARQFQDIGKICADICSKINGNALIFFPSYYLMNSIHGFIKSKINKKIYLESKFLNKREKENFIENFKKEKHSILLAVSSGSFGEGIDMPGVLKAVIVVGLPLSKPDLESQELIKYYDLKFGRGWDYGYVLPALTKTLQNAGRCIRREKDKGALIFLDERYANSNYYRCFPKEWDVKIENDYGEVIQNFFDN